MNDKKDGFLNAHAFSNEKGAFGKFLLFLLPGFFGGTCFNDIIHGRLNWYSIGFFLVVSAISSILYFITECLAYRTKLFPKFKRRELFHLLSFFLLFVLSAAVFMAIKL